MEIKGICPIIRTGKLAETKAFYVDVLGFRVIFEAPTYLGLRSAGGDCEIGFMPPEDGQPAFSGQGVTLGLETNPDTAYAALQKAGALVVQPPQDNPWGDRSCIAMDPNGLGLYCYVPIAPADEFKDAYKE